MRRGMVLVLAAAALLVATPPTVRAQQCASISANSRQRLEAWVARKYSLPQGSQLSVTNDATLPGSCVHAITLTADWPRIVITVMLSPDQRYAFPGVFDLASNPAIGPAPPAAAPASPPGTPSRLSPSLASEIERAPGPSRGAAGGATIVEFSDFECPFCRQLAATLRDQVLPEAGAQVRLVYHQFPLPMHPWAAPAAEMSACAARQSTAAFWQLHDYLFANQDAISPQTLRQRVDGVAAAAGLDRTKFARCVDGHEAAAAVQADIALGQRLGIHGTPTVFINGVPFTGARPAAELLQAIKGAQPSEVAK